MTALNFEPLKKLFSTIDAVQFGHVWINMITQVMLNTIIPVLKQHGVAKPSLLGSFVRNEENENSDVDILIQLPKGMSFRPCTKKSIKLSNK